MRNPLTVVIVYSKCSGLGLIAFSKASAHTFPYGGQAYYYWPSESLVL